MRAWNEVKKASVNNNAGHLKFSIPKIRDCISGSVYGSFVLEQLEGYDVVPAESFSWNVELRNFKKFNKDQRYYIVQTGFSSRWEYYDDGEPKYSGYIQLIVLNGYSNSGDYHEGSLYARIVIKRRVGNGDWRTDWVFIGDNYDYENIKINASLQGDRTGNITASCRVNDGEDIQFDLDLADFPDLLLLGLDLRPFSGLAAVTTLEMGCMGDQIVDLACPCDNAWKNHGEYVSCVAHAVEDQVAAGLISQTEKGAIVSERAKSGCGKKK